MFSREALEFLSGSNKTEVLEINGLPYTTRQACLVEVPTPDAIRITTLSGLVGFIQANIDAADFSKYLLHVRGETEVVLLSAVNQNATRSCPVICKAQLPSMHLNVHLPVEQFNIMVRSVFVQDEKTEFLLSVTGNITESQIGETVDDGISQTVTVKQGINRKADVIMTPDIALAPFRTFTEVQQPSSRFVLRMKDGPMVALFEGDGGQWRNEAMQNIAEYLRNSLPEFNVIA